MFVFQMMHYPLFIHFTFQGEHKMLHLEPGPGCLIPVVSIRNRNVSIFKMLASLSNAAIACMCNPQDLHKM